jgi:hypothetical protein
MEDFWDPNTWTWMSDQGEYRIYDGSLENYAIVDYEDYVWATKWCWYMNKPHPRRKGSKRYFVRNTSNGRRNGDGKLFLHIEIARRAGLEQPSELHCWIDHKDGNEHNCRRSNLRYLTPKQNNATRKPVKRRGKK